MSFGAATHLTDNLGRNKVNLVQHKHNALAAALRQQQAFQRRDTATLSAKNPRKRSNGVHRKYDACVMTKGEGTITKRRRKSELGGEGRASREQREGGRRKTQSQLNKRLRGGRKTAEEGYGVVGHNKSQTTAVLSTP